MDRISGTLTVYFEDPFWIGVFERISDGTLSVCKVTFGAEPKEYEVWDFVLRHYSSLMFCPAVKAESKSIARNPKRRLRDAKKQMQSTGIGTKSQQVLKMQREEQKIRRRQAMHRKKEAEKEQRFELKQQKRKEKHRGHERCFLESRRFARVREPAFSIYSCFGRFRVKNSLANKLASDFRPFDSGIMTYSCHV